MASTKTTGLPRSCMGSIKMMVAFVSFTEAVSVARFSVFYVVAVTTNKNGKKRSGHYESVLLLLDHMMNYHRH